MRREILIFLGIFLFCQALPVPEQKETSRFVYKQDGLPLQSSKFEDELKQLHQAVDKRKIQSIENVIQNQKSPIESKINSTTHLTLKTHSLDYEEAIPIVIDTKYNNQEHDDLKNSHDRIQGTEKTKAVLQAVNQRPLSITTTVMSITSPRIKPEKIAKTPLLDTIKEEDEKEDKIPATDSPTVAAEEAPEMDNSVDDTEKREAGENRMIIDPKEHVMSKGEALVDEELMEFMIKLAEHPKLWTRVRQIFDKIDGEERSPIWLEDPRAQNKVFQEQIKPKSEEVASVDNEPKETAIPNESVNEIMNTESAIKDKKFESDQLPEVEPVSKNNRENSDSQINSLPVTVIPDEHDSHEEIPEIFTEVTIHNTVDHRESSMEPEPSPTLTEEQQDVTIQTVNDKKLELEVTEQEDLNSDHTSQPVDVSSLNVDLTSKNDEPDNKSEYVEKELQAVASENIQVTPEENTAVPDLEDTSNDLEDMEEQLIALRQNKSWEFTESVATQTPTLHSRSM